MDTFKKATEEEKIDKKDQKSSLIEEKSADPEGTQNWNAVSGCTGPC